MARSAAARPIQGWDCDACATPNSSHVTDTLTTLPSTLVLHLDRAHASSGRRAAGTVKSDCIVNFPLSGLQPLPLLASSLRAMQGNTMYHLTSVVVRPFRKLSVRPGIAAVAVAVAAAAVGD